MPSPTQAFEALSEKSFVDEDGGRFSLIAGPALSPKELQALQDTLPGPIPAHIQALLLRCGTFEFHFLEPFGFRVEPIIGQPELARWPIELVCDGIGNAWYIDVAADGRWGPVLYADHEMRVLMVQARTLAEFLQQLADADYARPENGWMRVPTECALRVASGGGNLVSHASAAHSHDPLLREFAAQSDDTSVIADLRELRVGTGFKWEVGRTGTVVRHPTELLWAIEPGSKRPSLFDRLLRG